MRSNRAPEARVPKDLMPASLTAREGYFPCAVAKIKPQQAMAGSTRSFILTAIRRTNTWRVLASAQHLGRISARSLRSGFVTKVAKQDVPLADSNGTAV